MVRRSITLCLCILAALAACFSAAFYLGKSSVTELPSVETQIQPNEQDADALLQEKPEEEDEASRQESAGEKTEAPPEPDEQGEGDETVFPLNLNTADAQELMQLPGIGEVIAERILDYREENGRFVTAEQVMDVKGIGEKTWEKIKDLISVE